MNKEPLNKQGQTLSEFLAEYNPKKYKHPSVTADCVVFSGNKVMLIKRGNHPYIGELAFAGGFSEEGESTEETAVRELKEETGLELTCRQFYTASKPGRDPRDWTVSVCYMAEIEDEKAVKGGDDAADASWYEYDVQGTDEDTTLTLKNGKDEHITHLKVVRDTFGKVDVNKTEVIQRGMAFDHAEILLRAIEERKNVKNI